MRPPRPPSRPVPRRVSRRRAAAAFVVLGLVASACGDGRSTTAGSSSTATGDAVATTAGPATPPSTGVGGDTTGAPAPTTTVSPTDAPAPPSDYPSFTAITVTGASFDLADHAGTDVVLWFWAPW